MLLEKDRYIIEGFLRTYKSKILISYPNVSLFTDKENELILQGKLKAKDRKKLGVKEWRGNSEVLTLCAELEIKSQRKKLELRNKMFESINKLVFQQGWQCYKCREIKKLESLKSKPSSSKLVGWLGKDHAVADILNNIPLEITQEEKEFICETCSSKIFLKFIKTEKVIIINIKKLS